MCWAFFNTFHVHFFSFKLFVDLLYWLPYYFTLLIYVSSLKILETSLSLVICVADTFSRFVGFTLFQVLCAKDSSKFPLCHMYLSFTASGFSILLRKAFLPPSLKINSFQLLHYLCSLYVIVGQWCCRKWNKIWEQYMRILIPAIKIKVNDYVKWFSRNMPKQLNGKRILFSTNGIGTTVYPHVKVKLNP